ncbi:MAG: M23 family metallopeptidase [Devosia sp.]|uniref:M23 family metallopeptidase n=1 Tax=Devosia sp. TaxID=1871048 RepID=UPI001A5BBE00|nr:M23 family metallopeptidase [Devosia sp.]MBL8596689.1 M23 family metallopeptidase [Devosia sp.]
MRKSVLSKPFAKPRQTAAKAPSRLSVRPGFLYGGFAALLATNVLTLVGLLMAPDISRLFVGQNDAILTAYEDRISQLRLEVDRLQSRHYVQAGDINLQLQDLAQTQELLMEQHQYVKQLADRAAELGIEATVAQTATPPADPLLVGSLTATGDTGAQIEAAATSINRMMDESRSALAALGDAATSRTDEIVSTLAGIGIKPKLPSLDAVGGPLLPAMDGPESSTLIDDANVVAAALERYKAARGAADLAPVHKPLVTATRTSSTFGNRKDPFTGRLAFHSGIDYAAPQGTKVLSAGAGVVTYAGQMSGYGNVVEVTHGNGLVTRYGHLSSFLAKEGQKVSTGTPIAKVGSTGRSTGPHLHFEVRRSDSAVDPARYLNAGRALAEILAG